VRARRRRRRRFGRPILLAVAAIVALVTTGLLLRDWPAAEPKIGGTADAAPSAVSLRLSGPFAPDFAGELVAARAGLFEREGLQVTIQAGSPADDPLQLVAAGTDTFGVTGADRFLAARAQGAPIVAFAAAYLESPVVFYVSDKSEIHTPRDFVGKRIGYQASQDTATIYQAMMVRLSLARSQVHEIRVGSDLTPFLTRAVDVWPGHVGTEAYALSHENVAYNVFGPGDYGVHVPGTVYFAHEKIARGQPGLVRRFLRAVLAGWDQTYADEAASAHVIASYDPATLNADLVRFRLDQQREFLRPFGARFGEFEDTHWRSLQDILLQQRVIKERVDLSKAVTFDFLHDVYRRDR
jgi:ABC-type nitrate/sulfonate/bicarbonate transport system substrate-binding protein